MLTCVTLLLLSDVSVYVSTHTMSIHVVML